MRDVQWVDAGAVRNGAEFDLSGVGRALWRKKLWIIVPTILVAVLAAVAVNLITPKYKSEARILIEGRENVFLRPEAEKASERGDRLDPEAVTSQVQLVLSRDVARNAIGKLKLSERPEFDPVLRGVSSAKQILILSGLVRDPLTMSPEERVLESYYERIAAYPVDKSRVIAVEFQSADPDLAARVANVVAETYLTLQQTAKQEQTRVASQWLAGEIEVLRKRVAEAEGRVEEFRSKSNLFVGSNNTPLSSQQLGEINTQLAIARAQKAEAEAKAGMIRNMLKTGQPLESYDVLNSELIRRLSEQAATLQGQLAEQSSTLLPGHPRIKELRAQIGDLERQIRREAERLVRSLENDARFAGARVDTLNTSFDQIKRQAASSNEQDVQLRALDREAKSQRDLLESYLAKYREATARDSLGVVPAEARIISPAVVSSTPFFPKKVPIVLMAALATLVLFSALIAAGELLSGRSSREEEPLVYAEPLVAAKAPPRPGPRPLRDRLMPRVPEEPEPVVLPEDHAVPTAEVPVVPAAPDGTEDPLVVPALASIEDMADTIREEGEGARRVAVIGAAEGANASVNAIALARSLARDRRVILIDLACAGSAIKDISSEPNAPGMTDLIQGRASFRHVIARDRMSSVHLIAAGEDDANADTLLSAERVRPAIDALAHSYDYMVIDAGLASKAERLAAVAPWAVLVAGPADAGAAHEALETLTAAGFATVIPLVPTTAPEMADADAAA
jgi:succinoglycan biosynthesis transport protein ExoP